MNKSIFVIMGGALIVAVIVAMVVQSSLAPKDNENKEMPVGVEILVANKLLLKGGSLKATDVSWKSFAEDTLFKGVVKKSEQADEKKLKVYDKPLLRDIESGEPITTQSLIMDSQGGGANLSVRLKQGMRAVGIAVKADTIAGGFIAPGDHVDVILTYQVRLKGEAASYSPEAVQTYASETILTNVRVLAVDQNSKEKSYEAKIARTVTLETDAKGAQLISMSASMGNLSLSLRRMGEKDTDEDRRIPVSTDVNNSKVIKEIYKTMDNSRASSNTVRVYSGTDITNVPVSAAVRP